MFQRPTHLPRAAGGGRRPWTTGLAGITVFVSAVLSLALATPAHATQSDVFAAGVGYCASTYRGHGTMAGFGPAVDINVGRGEADSGHPLYAPADGTVTVVGGSGWGRTIIWTSRDGREQLQLAHLRADSPLTSRNVRAGELIGRMGRTGTATGVHLHIARRLDGRPAPLVLSGQRISPPNGMAESCDGGPNHHVSVGPGNCGDEDTNGECETGDPGVRADFNGDGRDDLGQRAPGGVSISSIGGGGSSVGSLAWEGYPYGEGAWRVCDFDGDGRDDLVHSLSDGLYLWRSKGDGTFDIRPAPAWDGYGFAGGTWRVGDFDGDGRDDLAHLWGDGVNLWRSKGDGTFDIRPAPAWDGYGFAIGTWRVGDFNGDGRDDLVHRWGAGFNLWLSRGDGTFDIGVTPASVGSLASTPWF